MLIQGSTMPKKDLAILLVLSANTTIKYYCKRSGVLDYLACEWLKEKSSKILVQSHSHVKYSPKDRKASETAV